MSLARGKIDKKRLMEDTNEEKWDADTVALVLLSKMINRSKKNKSVHPVYVLVSYNQEAYQDMQDEFDAFLHELKEKIDNDETVPSRFQVALQYKTDDYLNHWITLDAKYGDGKLDIFILDSIAGDHSDVLSWSEQTKGEILTVFPRAHIYYYNGPRLQSDGVSCSIFTINSILALQECDVLSTFNNSNSQGRSSKINPDALPIAMNKIFRPTQSYQTITNLPSYLKKSVASKKGNLTLQDVVEQHKSKDQRHTNEYIIYKKQRYIHSMKLLLEKMKRNEIADVLDNRAKGLPIVIDLDNSVIKKHFKVHAISIFKKKITLASQPSEDKVNKLKI